MGLDISVGIANCYGLDGPGIESRWWGQIFYTRPDRPWGPPILLYSGQSGRGVAFTYPQLKPRVKMSRAIPPYFYTAFGSVWLYLYPHY